MNDLNNIFNHSHCLSQKQLIGYLNHSLDADEAYLVETHISDCQFCSDAIDGLLETDLGIVQEDLGELKSEFADKLKQYSQLNTPIASIEPNKMKVKANERYKWLAAASVLLVIGLGGYSVFSYIASQKHEMALKNESKEGKNVPVEYALPNDSQAGEIVHLEVKPDEFNKLSKNTDNKFIEDKKNVPATNTNTKEVETQAAPSTRDLKAMAAPKRELVIEQKNEKDNFKPTESSSEKVAAAAAPVIDNESNYVSAKNYAEERLKDESEKEVVAKAPAGKMKKNLSNQSPVASPSNQLNYPVQTSDNNINYGNANQTMDNGYGGKDTYSKKSVVDDYELGLQAYNEGNFRKSIKMFEKALSKATDTNKEDIQFHLAQAYLKQGKTEKAEELFALLANGKKYKNAASELIKKSKETKK